MIVFVSQSQRAIGGVIPAVAAFATATSKRFFWTRRGASADSWKVGLADTSVFIARETDRPHATEPPEELPEELMVSTVTIGELRLGVLIAEDINVRQRRLTTLQLASQIEPLPIDDAVASAWAALVAGLRAEGRRMPINDSWIAATAIAHDIPSSRRTPASTTPPVGKSSRSDREFA